jgi:hypothetical protein
MSFNGKEFGQEIVSVVKHFLRQQVAPLEARIEALEEAQARGDKSRPTVRVPAPTRQARP